MGEGLERPERTQEVRRLQGVGPQAHGGESGLRSGASDDVLRSVFEFIAFRAQR